MATVIDEAVVRVRADASQAYSGIAKLQGLIAQVTQPPEINVRAKDGGTRELKNDLNSAMVSADRFAAALTRGLTDGVRHARSLSDIMKGVGQQFLSMALGEAMKPLNSALGDIFSKVFSSIKPFARGGVLSGGMMFPMAGGQMGLAGEAGPEAILPLARGADGTLGVRTGGSGAGHIIVNISTPDARSFVQAEGQISGLLARAVARGQRNL